MEPERLGRAPRAARRPARRRRASGRAADRRGARRGGRGGGAPRRAAASPRRRRRRRSCSPPRSARRATRWPTGSAPLSGCARTRPRAGAPRRDRPPVRRAAARPLRRRCGSSRRAGSAGGSAPGRAASWSPHGRFVVVWRGRRLAALDLRGRVRWSLLAPRPVTGALWSPSGFRVAYRSGQDLRVVAGDGTGDRLLDRRHVPADGVAARPRARARLPLRAPHRRPRRRPAAAGSPASASPTSARARVVGRRAAAVRRTSTARWRSTTRAGGAPAGSGCPAARPSPPSPPRAAARSWPSRAAGRRRRARSR